MLALIKDQEKNFDKANTQDILVFNLDHRSKIVDEIELERKSHNKDLQENWNGDNFFQSLERIIIKTYDKHNLRQPSPTSSSTDNVNKSRWSKYQKPLNSVHLSDVNFTDGEQMFTYAVQGYDVETLGETTDGDFELNLLYNAVMQVASNMNRYDNKFDTSKTCAVCGRSGHAFDNC